jgi:glycosyltransferase involved in cell wall biosynthesis
MTSREPTPGVDTVIVVPCFNERERLPVDQIETFLRDDPPVSFLMVDDGSGDGTLELLRKLEAAWPGRVSVLALPRNVGKAEAVRAGMTRAFASGAPFVGYWDADLATPLGCVLDFRALLLRRAATRIVTGARVVLLGRHIERRPLRHYLGRVAATVTSLALGLRVYDTQCGAKLFRVTPDVEALFAEPFLSRWIFDIEVLARLVSRSAETGIDAADAVYEMPLSEWRDVAGSKVAPIDYLRAAWDLLRVWWRHLR